MGSLATLPACCGPECARREFLRDTAIEAARRLMACQLRYETRERHNAEDRRLELEDAWQTFRDSLHAERVHRG
jgi:hypothetical protein